MELNSKIYVAGHRGMVGSAIVKDLVRKGFSNIITRTSSELNLINQQAVSDFFESEKPEYVFLAAAKVGGIIANNTYRADFIFQNLMIQNNVIHQSYLNGVKKLMFFLFLFHRILFWNNMKSKITFWNLCFLCFPIWKL